MNLIPKTRCQNLIDFDAIAVINLNPSSPGAPARDGMPKGAPSCIVQRQPATASVTAGPADAAVQAANDADAVGRTTPHELQEPSAVVHFDQACHVRRFEAWLHGSAVLEAPLPACRLDRADNAARALASQLRAVRETSYLPARASLLFP